MDTVKNAKEESWVVYYQRFEGMERRAVELISCEVGKYIAQANCKNAYILYVLPCEREEAAVARNAIVLGLYYDSKIIQKYIDESELDGKDYLVKVIPNPEHEDCRIAMITAKTPTNLFYGAVSFLDDYQIMEAPIHGGLRIPQWIYDYPMLTTSIFGGKKEPEYCKGGKAETTTRGIFTWGHPINDYRAYIRDMARLKLNQIILWNDYMPLNAKEIVEYAHSFGLEVIFGYSWGWTSNFAALTEITEEWLKALKIKAIAEYENNYAKIGCDGIYFQSFTEMSKEYIGDKLIAEVVTDFVNDVSGELLSKYPKLHIQFGLHASSVKKHLDKIAKVDKRVEILWEDCGSFPSGYAAKIQSEEAFEETLEFARQIVALREGAAMGFVIKGFATLNWEMFKHQAGPFILGENDRSVMERDNAIRKPMWKQFEGEWLKYGVYAHKLIKEVVAQSKGKINLCMAGVFDGGIWLPEALCAEMMWSTQEDFSTIVEKVVKRSAVNTSSN